MRAFLRWQAPNALVDNDEGGGALLRSMPPSRPPILHVLCGKLASGKTRLAQQIAHEARAFFFSEDLWLARLFPGEIKGFDDYFDRSSRFRAAIAPHLRALLERGNSVVLDFAGNSPNERAWALSLSDAKGAAILHYIQASDEWCKRQLQKRNDERPEGSQVTTEAEFDFITKYFVVPNPSEGFIIQEHNPERS